MELRDYLRMLRRGWPTVLAVVVLFMVLAVDYLALAPKRYDATATLLVSPTNPTSIDDLQQGSQFAINSAVTYAQIIDSATVLGPLSDQLQPRKAVGDLEAMITATARIQTTLIDVTATSDDPREAASVANAAASSGQQIIPGLVGESSGGRRLVKVELIKNAVEPTAALSPNTRRVLALGLVLGLALGLALTIARQALDTRMRRPEDVGQVSEVPVLAALPALRRSQRQSVVVRDDPSSRAVEAYRSLRTNLIQLEDGDRRSLLFAAVADDHDGAEIPINLAWSIAQAGRRVLLVDLDLRNARVADMLEIRAERGLADVLSDTADLDTVLCATEQPGLEVVLSGTPQRSPSDLLSAPVLGAVLRHVEERYDYVILHAPPLLTYTDAAVVSRVAGQTLVTVSAGRTRADELTTALVALATVHVEPRGLVLAGVRGAASDNSKARSLWARSRVQTGVSSKALGSPTESTEPSQRPSIVDGRLFAPDTDAADDSSSTVDRSGFEPQTPRKRNR